jgi:hypothetical protein
MERLVVLMAPQSDLGRQDPERQAGVQKFEMSALRQSGRK